MATYVISSSEKQLFLSSDEIGTRLPAVASRARLAPSDVRKIVEGLARRNLVELTDDQVRLTKDGRKVRALLLAPEPGNIFSFSFGLTTALLVSAQLVSVLTLIVLLGIVSEPSQYRWEILVANFAGLWALVATLAMAHRLGALEGIANRFLGEKDKVVVIDDDRSGGKAESGDSPRLMADAELDRALDEQIANLK